jgi:ATP-dependent DNA ligase
VVDVSDRVRSLESTCSVLAWSAAYRGKFIKTAKRRQSESARLAFVTRAELLAVVQAELRKHDFDCFVDATQPLAPGRKGVVVPGCPYGIPRFKTMRLHQLRKPFDSPDWLFELKHDGFHSLAYIDDGRCQLISRRNLAYKSFDNLNYRTSPTI